MTTFDRREEAFENRFAHDEDLTFKAQARRNRQLGLWTARLPGKPGAEAEDYAQALVASGIEGGGADGIVRHLQHDFGLAGVAESEHEIRRRMDDVLAAAQLAVRSA